MSKISICASALLTLALLGCTTTSEPVALVHKEGSTLGDRAAAYDACTIASFKEIPQVAAIASSPGIDIPGTTSCSTNFGVTTCQNIGGVHTAPSLTSYDSNRLIRARYVSQCLRSKGFSVQETVTCSEKDAPDTQIDRQKQRPMSQIGCVSSPALDNEGFIH